jgi:acetate kinase
MKVLVINCGSSSLKYQLIDMETEQMVAKGNVERIGLEEGNFSHKTADGRSYGDKEPSPNHTHAFNRVIKALLDLEVGVIKELSEISAVGHRVVQGGSRFCEPELINDEVLQGIAELGALAPLHNPAHVQGIKACQEVLGKDVPQVAVFDTAFHSTMPPKAYMYAIPYEYYTKYNIRRYGAHGTSHRFVSKRCIELLGKDAKDTKIITCHIGNGSSITAVDGGKCIDTTMGLTPLDGFMMGTRTGALDPSVVTFIEKQENLSAEEMDTLFNKKSGLLGISGVSSDDRDVAAAEKAGNPRAHLAHEMLVYQIQKFIGAFAMALGRVDAIVFTAGLGENQSDIRKRICDGLELLGVKLNDEVNAATHGAEALLSTEDSKVKVYCIPTNEELAIAQDTQSVVSKL